MARFDVRETEDQIVSDPRRLKLVLRALLQIVNRLEQKAGLSLTSPADLLALAKRIARQ